MHAGHETMFRRRFFVSTLLSIPVLLYSEMLQEWLGFSAPAFPGSEWIVPVFAVIVFAYGGVPFLEMAVPELRDRAPGMMTLISMAIAVAFVYSLASLVVPTESAFFWELVTLIDIMLLGHWIEMRSVRRASSALDELAKLMPDTAERITDDGESAGPRPADNRARPGEIEEVPASELAEGDLVLVRPGASVPADGVVETGESDVDESMITGESTTVSKEPGDEVIGGTVNGDGSLRVRISATGEETTLAGIMRLVEEAQSSESKTQALADRAAGWLFYVALGAAAVTAVAWTIATGFDSAVIERVVTVLVIACPHALGLAIPLVVAINTSLAARNGMLVRDRIAMEQARTLDTVVFDKTGTLTEGDVPTELERFAARAGENAQTVVYLVREGEPVAAFALADVIRAESYRVVDALHELGLEVAMLTGDSEDVARAVAADLGIDTVFAEVLPEDKDEKITELQKKGKSVAMVGDGVNDAPALARADIGIAIGSGTDVAVQSADIVLVQNNPMDVVRLVKLSRASYRKMQQNLVWAAGYNVFAIPLAAGVLAPIGILLSPAVGALLMSLSTVLVAINAQFLRRTDLSIPGLPGVSAPREPRPAD